MFKKRHQKSIAFARALRQEGIRFDSVNAENRTTHIAAIEDLIKKHKIDASRLANLDEAGATAEKEALEIARVRKFTTRDTSHHVRLSVFRNVSRVTIMPVIFANGEKGRPLFVFKGTKLSHRVVKTVRGLEKQSLTDCIPRYSIVITREDLAGVDKRNFVRWAEIFVKDVSDRTRHGRKILLLYNGYRSHMSLKVLRILREGNVIAYCLPAHTSGKTQPLHLTVFAAFKHHIAANMKSISLVNHHDLFDCCDFCNILRDAYEKSFTPSTICAGFERAGLWPINAENFWTPPNQTV